VNKINFKLSQFTTRKIRRILVGPDQRWAFEPPPSSWTPPRIENTSLYLHVPFCIYFCPYCPYTKVPYQESLIEPYMQAAVAEVDWWADKIGSAELTSIYIGGGTPTLALDSVSRILDHIQKRFNLVGEICIETNPADITIEKVRQLHDANISLVSLGIQSFNPKNLALIGRRYNPFDAERALALLTESGFSSVNADLMFALPGQTIEEIIQDLQHATNLGADQLTTYPLFTFPYTSIGEYLQLTSVRMPRLGVRKAQYRAINKWCEENNFKRVSVWGFKHGDVPRYSSVTRDGYIGIGPGAGSHLPDSFVLNTFDLDSWISATASHNSAIALRMPFTATMSGWWWLYWRFYDTRIPLNDVHMFFGKGAWKALTLLRALEYIQFAIRKNRTIELTEPGAFWVHLAQNHFALNYVNTIWTRARLEPWPQCIPI
jgi:coproporphyrinogen III oxidase-like Fe-S oxidoreductase